MKIIQKSISKSFTKQVDQSDCGVACLSMVIKYHNGFATLERLRELSGTSKQGTTLMGLYQAAKQFGFDAQGLEAENVENLKELCEPAILHVLLQGSLQHYYVFFWFDKDDNVVVADPAKGILTITVKELEQVWNSKALLKLVPNENFIKTKQQQKEKWGWFRSLIEEDSSILLVALFLGVVIAVLGLSTAIYSQRLIDKTLPKKDLQELIIGLILVLLLLLIRTGLNYLRGHVINRQNKEFNNRVIEKFYSALINLPKSFFDTRKVGDLVARMNDTRRIQNTINAIIGNILIDMLVIIISLFAIFLYSPLTGCLVSLSIVLFIIIILSFHKRIVIAQKEVMQSYAYNESNFIDTIQGIDAIKSNSKESFFIGTTKNIYNHFQHKIFNLGKVNIQFGFWSELVGVILLLGIFAITSYQVVSKDLLIGQMVAVITLAGSIVPAMNRLANFNIQIQEAKVAFDRMYEFSSLKPEIVEEDNIDINTFESIHINSIDFRFAGRSPLLKKISLIVNRGEFVAIIGESGVGKSTLIQILQKFYKPENGVILVNGIDLYSITTKSWRNTLGVIPQHVKIFNGTLIENICLDNPAKEIISVQNFCKDFGFDSFFNSFPNGYFTLLGEEGINISGGQQQLVALARALYKKPKVLILDEATSAMDRNTENFILNLLAKLKGELTTIMVTHRIKTASKADRIYILENGIIVNSGTPKELMITDNFYSLSYKEL